MITFRKLGNLGRFGNQLFQYAGTRLYAQENGFSWTFPDWVGNQVFSLPKTKISALAKILPTIQLDDLKATSWSERLLTPLGLWRRASMAGIYKNPRDNLNLYGYLQDPHSLEILRNHKKTVLSFFPWQAHLEKTYRETTKDCPPWVAVHIRRGDFVKRGHNIPLDAYLQIIEQNCPNKLIYLATDDPTLKQELRQKTFIVSDPLPHLYAYTLGDLFDFWMLQQATTVIAGGSTFPWWVAYLGNRNSYFAPPLTHTWTAGYEPRLERQLL